MFLKALHCRCLTRFRVYSYTILYMSLVLNVGSSCPDVFRKKGVLRNFAKFTGIHLCQRLFFNKVAGLRPETLLKKSLWHRCFPVNIAKFLKTPIFIERLW